MINIFVMGDGFLEVRFNILVMEFEKVDVAMHKSIFGDDFVEVRFNILVMEFEKGDARTFRSVLGDGFGAGRLAQTKKGAP